MESKQILKFTLYTLTCPIIFWAAVRLFFNNEYFKDISWLYWMLPTLVLLVISIIVFFLKKSFLKSEFFLIFVLSFIFLNFESQVLPYCEEEKNTTSLIAALIIALNLGLLTSYSFFSWSTIKKSFPFLMFFCCFNMLNSFFYKYSIFFLFDKIIFG
jgi:hypothetical protein